MMAQADFWNNQKKNASILKERSYLSNTIKNWKELNNEIEESRLLLDMAIEENDSDTLKEVTNQIKVIEGKIKNLSIELMLNGEDDQSNAIVSINAGAGGTDSQDWAEMLYRMYRRWAAKKDFQIRIIDYQDGDEAGLKGVTFSVNGKNAYGYLKVETGVHRLVRISPFNASGKRHTSFSSVFVYPELNQEIVIEIADKDLRIDVYRASGAGGQHVNKTSSAVRITHLPTGTVAQCQQESSQHRNKEIAMKVLQAKLYQEEKQKQNEKLQEIHDNKDDIAWGSQIRSYVMHPYQMVKDHRTNIESGNVKNVLNGELDMFIEGVLFSGV